MSCYENIRNGFEMYPNKKCVICGVEQVKIYLKGNWYCNKHGLNRYFEEGGEDVVGVDLEK